MRWDTAKLLFDPSQRGYQPCVEENGESLDPRLPEVIVVILGEAKYMVTELPGHKVKLDTKVFPLIL